MKIRTEATVLLDRRADRDTTLAHVVNDRQGIVRADDAEAGFQLVKLEVAADVHALVRLDPTSRRVSPRMRREVFEVDVFAIDTVVDLNERGELALMAAPGEAWGRGMVVVGNVEE